jgi:glycosyltransferase involved in cell wall biosynthesis
MIFISGDIIGSYRSQNILKALVDNKKSIAFMPTRINFSKHRWIRLCTNSIYYVITLPFRILLIASSAELIVLPMNTNKFTLVDVLVAKMFGKQVIYEYYISLYDTLLNDRKTISSGSFKARLALFYDKAFTMLSDKIVCLNQSEIDSYKNYMAPGSDKKISIIPLVIDYYPEQYGYKKEKIDTIIFCWWGTYIPLHGLEMIIESFALSMTKSHLYVFGDSDSKSKKYRELATNLGIEGRVHFNHEYNFQNGQLPSFLYQNDVVALGVFGESKKAKSVLPNKTIDSCMLSIPTLTVKNPATEQFFTDGIDIIYADRNAKGLAEKIDKISEGGCDLTRIGNAAYQIYNSEFSPHVFKDRYLNMLNEK